ncbi:MAG: Wzz/FepE/Etk N-terminal domain-containing protein [Oscillospiraceae bacterium]|nr:Wzz/FepE/Etk N-terminal domain-containing protein [Oscillospiraceae bacterium]
MEYEIDLRKILQILYRHLLQILGIVVLFGAAAGLITHYCVTPVYQATGSMYVFNSEGRNQSTTITSTDIMTSQKLVDTYIVVLRSNATLTRVAENVNLGYSAQQIGEMFSAAPVNDTEIFSVSIQNKNPAHAQRICNAFLEIAPSEIMRVVEAGAVKVVDSATLPTVPITPSLTKNIALAALLGLILAAMLFVLRELLDTRVKCEENLSKRFNIPVFGSVPLIKSEDK